MKSDVSGNELFEESSDLDIESGEDYETSEQIVYSVDYSSYFEDLQNSFNLNNALLLACILLIGVLMGLKNER